MNRRMNRRDGIDTVGIVACTFGIAAAVLLLLASAFACVASSSL